MLFEPVRVHVALQTRVNHIGRKNQRHFSQGRTSLGRGLGGRVHDHDFVRGIQKLARDGLVNPLPG